MTMLNITLPWIKKYSRNPIYTFTPRTIAWYKYCQKIGRRKYLKITKEKTAKHRKRYPNNLRFRIFKSTILKNKNINSRLLKEFQKLIEFTGSTKYGSKFRYLTPKKLLKKMRSYYKLKPF